MKLDASDARNTAGPTISRGSAMRFMRLALAIRCIDSGPVLRTMSVSTDPGASALTRMPRGASPAAIERVSDINPAFAPEYIAVGNENRNAPAEMTLTTDAHGLWSR